MLVGGIRTVAAAAGAREGTVSRGVAELESGRAPLGRVRRPGGGRKKARELDPELLPALLALVEPDSHNVFLRDTGIRDARDLADVHEIDLPDVGADYENTTPEVTPPPPKGGGFSLCLVGVATDQPGP